MAEVQTAALRVAIRNLHNCDLTWIEAIPGKETFRGQTVRESVVQVFDDIGHPSASRYYAWAHDIERSGIRRVVAVLPQGSVDSPEKVVRAAIVYEVKDN